MFSDTADPELRQGDIVEGLVFPKVICEALPVVGVPSTGNHPIASPFNLTGSFDRNSGLEWFSAQIKVIRVYSMILSPCCDLQLREGRLSLPAILAAPLLDVTFKIRNSPDDLRIFKENRLEDYTGQYYVEGHPPLPRDYMVDFCRIVSIPSGEYAHILRGKILQLTDLERVKFKIKLGLYFSRPTEEEVSEGLTGQPIENTAPLVKVESAYETKG